MEAQERFRAGHRTGSEVIELQVLVAVVETGSFSGAARRLGLSAPSITRHVSNLESGLGAKLIQRTTRSLSVTEVGAQFYSRARHILDELETAEAEVSSQSVEPRGRLRVAAPSVFAAQFLRPRLAEFMRMYPELTLELILTSEKVDMLRGNIDLSIQSSNDIEIKATPGFTAIKLSSVETGVFASPAYVASHLQIVDPEDLKDHNCLCGRTDTFNEHWPFTYDQDLRFVKVGGALLVDNGELILQCVRDGIGVAMLPMTLARPCLERGELVEVLPGRIAQTMVLYAIVPDREFLAKKTRLFIDFARNCINGSAEAVRLVSGK